MGSRTSPKHVICVDQLRGQRPPSLMGPRWPSVGKPGWLGACDDAPLRVPLRGMKSRLKVCVCEKHGNSLAAWGPLAQPTPLLFLALLHSGRLPGLSSDHQWRPCSAAERARGHQHGASGTREKQQGGENIKMQVNHVA